MKLMNLYNSLFIFFLKLIFYFMLDSKKKKIYNFINNFTRFYIKSLNNFDKKSFKRISFDKKNHFKRISYKKI